MPADRRPTHALGRGEAESCRVQLSPGEAGSRVCDVRWASGAERNLITVLLRGGDAVGYFVDGAAAAEGGAAVFVGWGDAAGDFVDGAAAGGDGAAAFVGWGPFQAAADRASDGGCDFFDGVSVDRFV
eukprot:gnl/TRDRNA2_/TRDRNA2_84069_c1_seq1.p2 gnl/TRDRNA2_/TRDRNA2_84069_c1~~gnl/TRDRNA2_/TRDRNA2_84069_c1_seq1.p2  ORF type:complete len:128 (-),score=17.89 gnl/TRDRNA2_/TRDRNA2_84069_c1_seq1:47-430(-)